MKYSLKTLKNKKYFQETQILFPKCIEHQIFFWHSAATIGTFWVLLNYPILNFKKTVCPKNISMWHWLSHCSLFVQTSIWSFFDRKTPCYWQNLIFYNHFYCTINRKWLGMHIPKLLLIVRKYPLKVTSTTFLFREIEHLAV